MKKALDILLILKYVIRLDRDARREWIAEVRHAWDLRPGIIVAASTCVLLWMGE